MNKTSVVAVLSISLLVSMIFPVLMIKPIKAWTGTVYIRADGSIDPSDAPIQRHEKTYTLTGDIYGSIIIEKHGITFDGAGYTVKGSGNGTGITLSGSERVTIKNVKIENFCCGISLNSSWIKDIYGYIWIKPSSRNIILSNVIENNEYGIYLFRSKDNHISSNKIANNYWGIYLHTYTFNNTISSNEIVNNRFGVGLEYSARNKISSNEIENNKYGVHVVASDYNSISLNSIKENNESSIWIKLSIQNEVALNNIINNQGGIILWESSHNNISSNNIENNNYGLCLSDGAHDNSIFHNNFVNNIKQIKISIGLSLISNIVNIWDDNYPSGGNYWSDYTGVDKKSGPNQDQLGSDGIGDTPYIINDYNRDRYPLMKPYNISFSPPSGYILHVQSYPITGIEISYYGDYSGTGTTNFDIGPKSSPFTVTLTAPSTYQDYTFDHWELDGVNVGQSNYLSVEVNEQNSVRVAKAVYKRPGYFVRLLFGDLEVENGSVLHVYFQTLKSEHAGSEVPINGVHIDWKTPFGINHTVSKTYNGVNGIIHLTYNLSSYSKTTFTIEMLPAQYDGFNVSPPSVNPLVLSLKPKQSMLVFGTELDFGASFEVDAEGRYYPYFLLANDGLEIYSARFSETSKMGFGVDYHLLKAEIGTINGEVGGCAHVGISSGWEYELNDVTINNQKTLLKYLVTKWILKNVRCVTPEVLRFLVDGLLAIVNAKLSQNGLENYRSLTKLGSYGYASLGAEVYVGLSSTKGSAKNKITKLLYGGITGDVEVDAGLNIYSLTRVGFLGELSFDGKIEAGAGLDMGFLNITAKTGLLSFSARAGVELIFDGFEPHALKFTFTMGVPADKSDIISFGGLLKPLNEKAVREGLKNGGKIKFTMSIPASKLTAELLEYLRKLPRGEIVFDELLMNLMNSIANTPIQYEIIVAENPIIIPIGIELKLGGIGVEFKWTYNEFPEHVVEKGIIYNWHCWPLTEYYSPPKSISTLQFIKDWYVQELFGTVVQLKEKGKHLYLHVYDSLGRHVGINYETSQIEIQIPDSYYFDNMNGTTFIVLPTNLTEFKIVVDGKFAQEPTENYTLTLMTFTENRANYTETFSTIKNGEKQEYQAIIPNTGTPTITQIITKPWWIQHQLWIVSGVIGTVAILTVSVALIRRRKSVPPTTN